MAWLSSGSTNEQLVCQLKENGLIRSDLIERAFTLVDRGLFVPGHDGQAYADMPVKVGNVHISAPHMYATILEALHLAPGHTFLNIGSGSGYLSSLVSTCVGAAGLCHGVELRGDVVRWANTCQEKWKTRIEEMRIAEKKKEEEKKNVEKNGEKMMINGKKNEKENDKNEDVMMYDGNKNEKREGDPLEAEAKRQKLNDHKDEHDHKQDDDDESMTSSPSLSTISSPASNVASTSNVSSPLSTHTSAASSAANSAQTTPNTNTSSLMSFLMRSGFVIASDEREGEEEPENDSDEDVATEPEPRRRHVIVIPDILHLLRSRSRTRSSTTISIRTWMIPDICKCQFFEGDAFCIDTTDANMKYDRIYVGAGAQPHHKEYFERMLAIGGVMVAPIGHQLVKVTRTAPTTFITRVLTEVGFAPLVGDLPDAVTSPTSPSTPLSPSSSPNTSTSSESSPSPSQKPLLLFPSPIYTPETHHSFPTPFQHAVDACIMLQRRHDGLPSRLPLSLWLDIIQYANRRWWVNVNAATSIPPSPQVNPETEGSPYDPIAAVSNRFWL